MRLREEERLIISSLTRKFAPDALVYVFGSRTNDEAKGGDIDLLLVGKRLSRDTLRRLKIELKELLGEQKIDILSEDTDQRTTFGKLIEADAIAL